LRQPRQRRLVGSGRPSRGWRLLLRPELLLFGFRGRRRFPVKGQGTRPSRWNGTV